MDIPFPFDRRRHARPSWQGRDDPLDLDAAGWALSPCGDPICRWMAADGFAELAREAAAALADLQRVAAIIRHPKAPALADMAAAVDAVAEAAGEAAYRAARKAGACGECEV